MVKYWLIITNKANWADIKSKEVFGFNERNKKKKDILDLNDILIIYIKPKRLGGIFTIKSLNVKNPINFHDGYYPHQIKIKKVLVLNEPLIIDDKWDKFEIIENMELFKNTKRWGAVLIGKSIISLSLQDYSYIKKLFRTIKHKEKDK